MENSTEAATVKEKAEASYEGSLPLEEAVSYFEAILLGMKKGQIHLRQGEEQLTLRPPAHLEIEVSASRKKQKERLSFEISWKVAPTDKLSISSD